MFGKKERAYYEEAMQKARQLLHNADQYPTIRKSAAQQAQERVKEERQVQEEQKRLREGQKRQREAQELAKGADTRRAMQASARERLQTIAKGLQQDGLQPSQGLLGRLARIGAEGYQKSHPSVDPAQVEEVFETEYQESFKTRTFFNPYTGEVEEW